MRSSSIRLAFADTLLKLAARNPNIFVVNADLKSSLYLNKFAKKYPRRFIECGVAESNAAGVAAGLAKTGKTVFLTSFSCFSPAINWAVIKQSICYNHANVKIIGSHSGLLSGSLGATHQMLEDVALMRSLPNMQVFSPADAIETAKVIDTITHSPLPAYVRLVRPPTPEFTDPKFRFSIGRANLLKTGRDITVIGHGPIIYQALEVQSKLTVSLGRIAPSLEIISFPSIKPFDHELIAKSIRKTGKLIVIEDHQKNGGLGEAVASFILENGYNCRFAHIAVDNHFGQSAKDNNTLYSHYHIATEDLLSAVSTLTAKV